MNPKDESIVLRALETTQGEDVKVYAFFAKGAEILEVADISRIERDADGYL